MATTRLDVPSLRFASLHSLSVCSAHHRLHDRQTPVTLSVAMEVLTQHSSHYSSTTAATRTMIPIGPVPVPVPGLLSSPFPLRIYEKN